MNEDFRRVFLPKAGADEKKVIKAFTELNKANALKTKPKVGFPLPFDMTSGFRT